MKRTKEIAVIGAGIVGLATVYQLLRKKKNIRVRIYEKESSEARHQTGNNSGVIHSGIYYKPGSLKAKNCVEGYRMLLEFAKKYKIPHEICGKIIVATDETEIAALENIYKRGLENGLRNLKRLDAAGLKKYEPHVSGVAGLFVPQTGIIDYKTVCSVLRDQITELGGEFVFNYPVTQIEGSGRLRLSGPAGETEADFVISCAGLHSDKLARQTHPEIDFQIIPFRGEYYSLEAAAANRLVKNLIYPVPDPNFPFLGVHFTRRIDGSIEAGPNAVLAFAREGYKKSTINFRELGEIFGFRGFRILARKYWRTGMGEMYRSFSKRAFTKALQKLVPEIRAHDLRPGGAGIRAQACKIDGTLVDDFLILEKENCVHVCNAPSPAATSCLSIGAHIAGIVSQKV